jgi:hypothetical protein
MKNIIVLICLFFVTVLVALFGATGSTYSCSKCGFSRTYFGIYKLIKPDNFCPQDNIKLNEKTN